MTGPTPYLHFPGTAREALTFYGEVFGCAVQLHTFAEFNRADGPADAIAHGSLSGGPVALFGADVSGDERAFRSEGMMLALLGTVTPSDPAHLVFPSRRSRPGRGRLADAAVGRIRRASH